MTHTIKLEKVAGERGARAIMVDGVEWGSIYMEGHGCHGPSYHFRDSQGENIQKLGDKSGSSYSRFAVRPDSRKSWRRHRDQKTPRPTEQLLFEATVYLIDAGLLKSPAELERLADKRAREFLERAKREEGRRRDKAEQIAEELIAGHDDGESNFDFARRIADALEAGL